MSEKFENTVKELYKIQEQITWGNLLLSVGYV